MSSARMTTMLGLRLVWASASEGRRNKTGSATHSKRFMGHPWKKLTKTKSLVIGAAAECQQKTDCCIARSGNLCSRPSALTICPSIHHLLRGDVMATRVLALLIVGSTIAAARADNWPGWRGPDGQGQCAEKGVPLTWSAKENVRWKVKLPDEGSSTPIVWGDRIFLTQASEKSLWPAKGGKGGQGGPAIAKKRSLWCLDRATGKIVWQKDVIYDEKESTHPTNPYCSASPVTDGERIVVSHGSAGMYCYDFSGKELWNYQVGKLEHD